MEKLIFNVHLALKVHFKLNAQLIQAPLLVQHTLCGNDHILAAVDCDEIWSQSNLRQSRSKAANAL